MFGLRWQVARDPEIEAMRLVLVALLRDFARSSPDPVGYLAARHAIILAESLAPRDVTVNAARPEHDAALRKVEKIFDTARDGLQMR